MDVDWGQTRDGWEYSKKLQFNTKQHGNNKSIRLNTRLVKIKYKWRFYADFENLYFKQVKNKPYHRRRITSLYLRRRVAFLIVFVNSKALRVSYLLQSYS